MPYIPPELDIPDSCLKHAVASLFDMHPRRVPHFTARSGFDWLEDLYQWSRSHGVRVRTHHLSGYRASPYAPHDRPPPPTYAVPNPDAAYWLAVVTYHTTISGRAHALVMRNADIYYDPDTRERNPRTGYPIHRYNWLAFSGYTFRPARERATAPRTSPHTANGPHTTDEAR